MSTTEPNATISHILKDGGEAIIIDAQLRTHYVQVAVDGPLVEHRRYGGNPGDVIPSLAAAIERGEDLGRIAGVVGVDMM